MKYQHWLSTIVISFVLSIGVAGQSKQLTKDQYYGSYRSAMQTGSLKPRHIVHRKEIYNEGKLQISQEHIYEYLPPERMKYTFILKFPDRTNKTELIQIGKVYYCRENGGAWKQSESWCAAGSGGLGYSGEVDTKYSVQDTTFNGEKTKLYQLYMRYKNENSDNKDKEGLSYYQAKYWLNTDGLLISEESENGLIDSGPLRWKQVSTYDYNTNIKIESPLK